MNIQVKDMGAVGDGTADDTTAIQSAIDLCAKSGGGVVVVDEGNYKIGTIFLKSNVTIELGQNGKISAQTERKYYAEATYKQLYKDEQHMDLCLFYAERCKNICIKGQGIIDGRGEEFSEFRPMMFRYLECENIMLEQIHLEAPASWTNAFIGCTNIKVDKVDIHSRANKNGDGLDFDGCNKVFVSNCNFDCSDDCICLQNSYTDKKCRNIVIENCVMSSQWAGIRIGLLSCGVIENLTLTNCIFENINCSAIKIQSAEGAEVRQMVFHNLIMNNVQRPIFMTANRHRERVDLEEEIRTASCIRDILFSHIIINNIEKNKEMYELEEPCCIVLDSLEDDVIERVRISDVIMHVWGDKECKWESDKIPTQRNQRAEGRNYKGTLPAKGIFARNIVDFDYQNIKILSHSGNTKKDIVMI